jgi:hypothetical protein
LSGLYEVSSRDQPALEYVPLAVYSIGVALPGGPSYLDKLIAGARVNPVDIATEPPLQALSSSISRHQKGLGLRVILPTYANYSVVSLLRGTRGQPEMPELVFRRPILDGPRAIDEFFSQGPNTIVEIPQEAFSATGAFALTVASMRHFGPRFLGGGEAVVVFKVE